MKTWRRWGIGLLIAAAVAGLIRAYQVVYQPGAGDNSEEGEEEAIQANLTFTDVTLEQPDSQGNLLWRVKADEVTYSPDQQIAFVQNPDGELFQDGALVYRVDADTGEIRQDGKTVFLRGNIVATGVRDNIVLRGNELEWRPDEDLLIVRNHITGTHPQLQAEAEEARVFSRERRVELDRNVVATTTEEPFFKLHANHLIWHMPEQRVESDQLLRAEQLEENKVVNWVQGNSGEALLDKKVLRLEGAVQVQLGEMPLTVLTHALVWQMEQEMVISEVPVWVMQPEYGVSVTAREGQVDLAREVATFLGNVHAVQPERDASLKADRFTWTVKSQEVVAEGNVHYQQADPPLNVRGPRAVGRLDNQTVVVSGGQVVTEIVPE